MLSFRNLSKAYGRRQVLLDVSHAFKPGVYVLHGPNGIGKSTLLHILAGVIEPDAGEVVVAGRQLLREPLAAKACLSYVPDECPVYPFMTGSGLLNLVARAKRTELSEEVNELVARLGLMPHLDTRFGEMSLGTRKKMMLVTTWIGEPSVMLMDEPSNGLDQIARDVLIDQLQQSSTGRVILISTHDTEFASAVRAHLIPFQTLLESTQAVT